MEKISNAWNLAKSSWTVLSKDKQLIALPVIAAVVAIVLFLAIALPGLVLMSGSTAESTSNIVLTVFLGAAAIVATWVVVVGEAAVVAGAGERMDGGSPTVSSAFATARARAFRLLEWAVLATVVAVVLDTIEQRFGVLGKVISWIGGVAFRIMSFLALPVIVFENVGAIEGFKRSSALLKRTWGEQVSFNVGMGLLGLVAALPGLLVGGVLVGTGLLPLQVVGVAAAVIWVGLVFAVTAALSAVFKTALYRYANNLPVDPAFDTDTLAGSITPR